MLSSFKRNLMTVMAMGFEVVHLNGRDTSGSENDPAGQSWHVSLIFDEIKPSRLSPSMAPYRPAGQTTGTPPEISPGQK